MTREHAAKWYAALVKEPFGWAIEHAGRCAGVIRLHGFDSERTRAHLAIGIFSPEDRGRGLGTEAVSLILRYAFEVLGLEDVRLRVLAFNTRAIACYRRCGFHEVARETVTIGSTATEDVLMSISATARGD